MKTHCFLAVNPKRGAFFTKDATANTRSIMRNKSFAYHRILFWLRLKAALGIKEPLLLTSLPRYVFYTLQCH